MIAEMTSRFSRRAVTIGVALTFSLAAICSGQNNSVYTNPRAGSDDPRVGLKAGLYDAGEASFGIQRLISLPKPAGFAPDLASIAAFDALPTPPPPPEGTPPPRGPQGGPRANYGGTNSDLAFHGTTLFVGNYSGINFYDISNPTKIKLITSVVCPGGQGDVSVYGHLLFMSVEAANGRLDCGTQGFPTPAGAAPTPPPAADPAGADRLRPDHGVRHRRLPALIESRGFESSTLRTSHSRSRLLRYRPAVARIRIRSLSIRRTRTIFMSIFPDPQECVLRRSCRVVREQNPIKIRIPRCLRSL